MPLIPWNPSTTIATVTQRFRPLFSVPRFSNPMLNGGCRRLFNNSMGNVTNLCQIPGNETTSAARTSARSSCEVFHVSRIQSSCQFFPSYGVLGDCFLIHKSEQRLDVVSVKTLCSNGINPKFDRKFLCLRCGFTRASPAWVQGVLALLCLTILLIQEVSMNTVIPGTSFLTVSQEDSHVISCHHPGNSGNRFLCASSLSSFSFGFSISAGPCDRFPVQTSLTLTSFCCWMFRGNRSLLHENVGEFGEDEVEELFHRLVTTNGTLFSV